jgi:hypothetical protein
MLIELRGFGILRPKRIKREKDRKDKRLTKGIS